MTDRDDDLERVEVVDDKGSVWIFRDRISDEPGPILKPTPRIRERKPLRSKSSPIPSSVRDEVLDRCGRICEWCLVPGGKLIIHHKLLRSQGGRHRVEDCAGVHAPCHEQVHANPIEARRRGLIIGIGSNG